MLRRLPHQSAMDGFEDDEVIRDRCFSRVDNTQTEVPSSGGGSTEGTGRQRDEGRVQWKRSATYGKSVREYDRDRAATPHCDTMRVAVNVPECGKGNGDRERGAAETQTEHTEGAEAARWQRVSEEVGAERTWAIGSEADRSNSDWAAKAHSGYQARLGG